MRDGSRNKWPHKWRPFRRRTTLHKSNLKRRRRNLRYIKSNLKHHHHNLRYIKLHRRRNRNRRYIKRRRLKSRNSSRRRIRFVRR